MHMEPPGGGGGTSKRSMATTYGASQTWGTDSARLQTRKQNICVCAGERKQVDLLVQSAHTDGKTCVGMNSAFPACSKVVHTKLQ